MGSGASVGPGVRVAADVEVAAGAVVMNAGEPDGPAVAAGAHAENTSADARTTRSTSATLHHGMVDEIRFAGARLLSGTRDDVWLWVGDGAA